MFKRWMVLVFFLLLAPASFAACEKPVKFAGLTWESGQFTTALLRILVSEGYGCETEEVPGSSSALENALASDDIQVIGEIWDGRSPVMQQAVAENKVKVVGQTLKGGARQGWYVPEYLWQAEPGLRSFRDLPRYAALFADPQDPKKARFLNCPTGWTCETFNTRLLGNTGLASVFNNVHPGTGAALDAEISAAYEQKKPLLFYYWQPTGLMAKYRFRALEFPDYDEACWQTLLQADSKTRCVSGFPVSRLAVAVSQAFAQQQPELVALLDKLELSPDELNGAILAMQENRRSADEQARLFLQENPDRWRGWLDADAAERVARSLNVADKQLHSGFPQWSMQDGLNRRLQNLVQQYGGAFRAVSAFLLAYFLLPVERVLQAVPAWLLMALVGLLAWHATRRLLFAGLCVAGLFIIGAFGLWAALLQTLALLIVSVLVTVVLGVPVGVVVAGRERIYRLIQPVLDVMQTMPSFVYLIPVLMLFGLGKVPAVFATVVYAVAPLIRLTALGIRQVPVGMRDAGLALGMNQWQLMRYVVLPLARPSIMAGINQTVMMSLSMVVLASMIGAPGLGEQVLQSIQTLNVGQGVQAGGAIVVLAIIIDRITQAYGRTGVPCRRRKTGRQG